MRNLFLIVSFIILNSSFAFAQKQLSWNNFADVNFEPVYNAIYDTNFLMPTFGINIVSYQGEKVSIKGFFLDISGNGDIYLVSSKPMAACFFCGGAGPETIIEVNFKEKPPFKTDQVILVTGILELNADDVDHCNYILKDATGQIIN